MTAPSDVFHLIDESSWQRAQAAGHHAPESLSKEGFIHFSTGDQVVATANRHYPGRRDLLLLHIDLDKLPVALKYEPSSHGSLYPHLYAPLPLGAVTQATPFLPDIDGVFRANI